MHVQRMLKVSRVYTVAEILSKIFVKNRRKIGDLIYDHGLTSLRIGARLICMKILCDHCLHDLHLYIQNMLTNRIKAPQALRNTPPLLGAPKFIL